MKGAERKDRIEDLATRFAGGETEVAEELLRLNAGLLRRMMVRYALFLRRFCLVDDAEQEARMAILHAAARYDVNKGSFYAYAERWIRNRVLRYAHLNKNALGRSNLRYRHSLQRARREGRSLALSPAIVEVSSIETGDVYDHDDDVPEKFGAEDESFEEFDDARRAELCRLVAPALLRLLFLRDLEVATMIGRSEGRTLKEIGDERGVSRERIRQIEAGVYEKARKALEGLAGDRKRPRDFDLWLLWVEKAVLRGFASLSWLPPSLPFKDAS